MLTMLCLCPHSPMSDVTWYMIHCQESDQALQPDSASQLHHSWHIVMMERGHFVTDFSSLLHFTTLHQVSSEIQIIRVNPQSAPVTKFGTNWGAPSRLRDKARHHVTPTQTTHQPQSSVQCISGCNLHRSLSPRVSGYPLHSLQSL